jgi:hypothetical protein
MRKDNYQIKIPLRNTHPLNCNYCKTGVTYFTISDVHSALAEQDRRSFKISQVAAIFIHNLFIRILFTFKTIASDCLRAGRSGDRISVVARFSALVQTGPEAHPPSCTRGTGSFLEVRCGRGVTLTLHPLLVPRSKIE